MKVAIYARYSSDNQRDASIADQIRVSRALAERHGWAIAQEYSDRSVSGATLLRSGFQALMRDALNHQFDVVLAESLDRFSRDLAEKTHRGLRGRIEDGKSAGGLCYGYRVVKTLSGGSLTVGEREIEPAQAMIVERIFREFVAGVWKQDADTALAEVGSHAISNAVDAGAGQVEALELGHCYGHLSPLVNVA
jgi:DNA invertase Pin-like site-specific DNA recombinase